MDSLATLDAPAAPAASSVFASPGTLQPVPAAGRPLRVFGWAADEGACRWYRLRLPLGALKTELGWETRVGTAMSGEWREKADIIVAQRTCMAPASWLYRKMAAEGRVKLVYEIDDDLFTIDPRHNRASAFFHEPETRDNMIQNLKLAHLVTVTTEPLAEVMRGFNPNVAVLPNYVHRSVLDIPPADRRIHGDGKVVMGWGGSSTHERDWEHAGMPVGNVLRRLPQTRMQFLGNFYPQWMPADTKQLAFHEWTDVIAEHYHRVAAFDIGLAPLVRTLFNASKSGLKAVEYAALGVPAVVSDEPAYRDVVRHGETGYLVRRPEQWFNLLRTLVLDGDTRTEMGKAARKLAEGWTIQGNVHKWAEAYRSIM